jgi:endonuclease/exonuclease/phosphatase family metal-dependent hydrolase
MLRVASYNIRKAMGTDRRRVPLRILAVLNEVDADVVALQEADRRFGARLAALPVAMIEHHSPYTVVDVAARAGSIGWHGNALLVRKGIKVGHVARLTLPTLEPRGAVMADLTIDGAPLRVVGMHLDLSGLHRRRQGHAITAALAERDPCPTIVMGDTNEWRPHAGCLVDFARLLRIAPTGASYHSRRPVGRLDRIMVDHDTRIAACGVHHSPLATRASDHLPVWADVELAGNTR